MIVGRQGGSLIYLAARFSDSGVQLVVLIPHEPFVVHPNTIENFPTECPERNRVNKSFFATRSKLGITHTKGATQNCHNKAGTEIIAIYHRFDWSSDHICSSFVQPKDTVFDEVGWINRVGASDNDDIPGCRLNSQVHTKWRRLRWVIQEMNRNSSFFIKR